MPSPQLPHDDPVLAFYRACGVTVQVHEAPQNRFAEPARPLIDHPHEPVATQRDGETFAPTPAIASPQPAVPNDSEGGEAVSDARILAGTAQTLAALHEALRNFNACPLKATATKAVVGEGPVGALIMFVGEAPGREEDAAGRPFVGRSGKLLEKMLTAIGLTRDEVYISNVLPWRPPANRTPTPVETATCEPFIRREIALVQPKILVPLGGPSAKMLLRTTTGIVRQRGRWVRYSDGGYEVDALPTFHPAYLLRTPAEKRRTWQDLLSMRARLDGDDSISTQTRRS